MRVWKMCYFKIFKIVYLKIFLCCNIILNSKECQRTKFEQKLWNLFRTRGAKMQFLWNITTNENVELSLPRYPRLRKAFEALECGRRLGAECHKDGLMLSFSDHYTSSPKPSLWRVSDVLNVVCLWISTHYVVNEANSYPSLWSWLGRMNDECYR